MKIGQLKTGEQPCVNLQFDCLTAFVELNQLEDVSSSPS
jgi:hypothetical protein